LAFAAPAEALGVAFGGIFLHDTTLLSKNVLKLYNTLFLTKKSYASELRVVSHLTF